MARGRSPQEKKRLSYDRDRRPSYGANDKSSRKNIPRKKRRVNRAERRRAQQTLAGAAGVVADLDLAETVEYRVRSWHIRRFARFGAPLKIPDKPLGWSLEWRLARRVGKGMDDPALAEARLARIHARRAKQPPPYV